MSSWAGNLIRQARLEMALSQRELARLAGTSQATLSAYEAGHKAPTLETLARIIRAAGMDLRIKLAPYDDHDRWMAHYEEALPKRTLQRRRKQDLLVLNAARRKRGLDPLASLEADG
jgi:transcriptional regulator with XRE-family HTH domain